MKLNSGSPNTKGTFFERFYHNYQNCLASGTCQPLPSIQNTKNLSAIKPPLQSALSTIKSRIKAVSLVGSTIQSKA